MNLRKAAASGALFGVLSLTACGQTGGAPQGSASSSDGAAASSALAQAQAAQSSASAAQSSAEASASSASASAAEDTAPLQAKFGQPVQYRNNVVLALNGPMPYRPSSSASTGGAKAFALFTVTITNGSASPIDPSGFRATAISANTEAQQVFDSANGITLPTVSALLPGKSLTFKVVFGVADPNDLTVNAQPGFQYREAIYTRP
jgi:hypothetical protein